MFRSIPTRTLRLAVRYSERASVIRGNSTPCRQYSSIPEIKSGPPRLPKEQQEEFEKLQRIANSQAAIDQYNQQDSNADGTPKNLTLEKTDIGGFQYFKTIPEFEGDVNPKTGERGGPKQDPLRHANEWAFNGRVTDF